MNDGMKQWILLILDVWLEPEEQNASRKRRLLWVGPIANRVKRSMGVWEAILIPFFDEFECLKNGSGSQSILIKGMLVIAHNELGVSEVCRRQIWAQNYSDN
jgi:hypothetical protein